MRIIAVIVVWFFLGIQTAWTFGCAGVKLPSSIVICSDPELIQLADERQVAINEARARVGEEAWPDLWEDQKAWVRSYARACGVSAEHPPPIPVPASVKACFTRAAVARITYLRSYGTGTAAPAQPLPAASPVRDRFGPGFDCTRATRPLAIMICADSETARVDLRFNQAYWALWQQRSEAERQQLKEEDARFLDDVQERCGIPRSGAIFAETWQALDCISPLYEAQRVVWLSRLTGSTLEEAERPIERHIRLERRLRLLGFLATPAVPEGVYGPGTRAGILAWQRARNRPASGFLGDGDAAALEWEDVIGAPSEPTKLGELSKPPAFDPSKPFAVEADQIPLIEGNGVYRVSVVINGVLPLQFVLDPGAADVSIPEDVFGVLKRTGTITDDDYIGAAQYQLADGSTVQSGMFYIRELKLGSHSLKKIIASIADKRASLLLGQSFLKRFDSFKIDNVRHLLVLGGERLRGRIGIAAQDLTSSLTQASVTLQGAAIARVEPGGPADRAGIRIGDIIVAVDGLQVRRGIELISRIELAPIGIDIRLSVLRQGNLSVLSVPVEPVASDR